MKTRFKWRLLLVNPTTRIDSIEGDVVRLKVDGLVCSSVCALRTRQSLERLPGVRVVRVDFERGLATIEGEPHDAAVYGRAVTGVVALRWGRRAIESFARRWTPTAGRDAA